YINRKKNQRFDLYVLNEKLEEIKHLVFEKEPVRDGDVNIDMKGYPAGTYYFKMDNGKAFFQREFVTNGD
ncbi:MAG: hypothetical protein AAF570_16240, partial [Bacteroidota bacterium]